MTKNKLGNFVNIKTGKLDANASSPDGEYPFFTCSREPLKISSYSYDCKCVLVAGNGDLNVKYYEGKFDAYQRTYIIESKDETVLDTRYLYWFLFKYVEKLRELSIGGVIKYIKLNNLTDPIIPLLPLADQKRIVKIFDQADALRQKRKQAIGLLDDYLKSVFLEMFDKENTAWSTLKEISNFIDYRGKTPVKTSQGIQLITAKNVKEGYLDFQPKEFIAENNYLSWMRRGFPQKGDVLFTTEAPLGNIAILPKFDKLAFAQRIIVIQPKEMIKPEFLLFALNSRLVKDDICRRSTGSTVKGIRSKELVKVKIPVPELNRQEKFVYIFNSKMKLKQKMLAQSVELETQFQALMQKAFKGEL